MGFFGPDMGEIANDYRKETDSAIGGYVGKMSPYADAGKGLHNNDGSLKYGAAHTNATQPGVAWDVLGNVNDYLDPSINYGLQVATDQLANAYGSRGSLFSGAAGMGIADTARSIAEQGFGAAFDRAMADNSRINALGQQQFSNQLSIDGFNNNANGQNFQQQFGINNQNFSNRNDIYGTELGGKINAANASAQIKAGEKSPWDYIMDVGKLGTGAASAVAGGLS